VPADIAAFMAGFRWHPAALCRYAYQESVEGSWPKLTTRKGERARGHWGRRGNTRNHDVGEAFSSAGILDKRSRAWTQQAPVPGTARHSLVTSGRTVLKGLTQNLWPGNRASWAC